MFLLTVWPASYSIYSFARPSFFPLLLILATGCGDITLFTDIAASIISYSPRGHLSIFLLSVLTDLYSKEVLLYT